MKKNAFTMIELVFVIVVLGILSAIAIPRLAASRDDAHIAKGRADIASIRSAIINQRQSQLFRGNPAFITNANLDTAAGLFAGVMTYPIQAGAAGENGTWRALAAGTTYTYTINAGAIVFTYNAATGAFDCVGGAGTGCAALTD